MAFCEKCGHQLPHDAKFCPNCGASVSITANESHDNSRRNIIYEGEIYKCPNCGEILDSFRAVCPTCGYEIRDSHISRTVSEFTDKLEQAHTLDQKVELIRNFPIANNKEDIFEFIILASTNLTEDMPRDLYTAWTSKFEQCYQKAKVMFKNSDDFEAIQKIYEEAQNKIRRSRFVHKAKSAQNTALTILLSNVWNILGIVFLMWSIKIDRAHGNSSMHELIGVIFLIVSSVILNKEGTPIFEFLITAFCGVLSLYLSKFLRNGAQLDLGGNIVLLITMVNFFRSFSSAKLRTKPRKSTSTVGTEKRREYTDDSEYFITVPMSLLSFSEKNYDVIFSLFEQAGFTNIKTVPLQDLRKGIFRRSEERLNGLVESIHINGKPLSIFNRSFPASAAVLISYHSFQN